MTQLEGRARRAPGLAAHHVGAKLLHIGPTPHDVTGIILLRVHDAQAVAHGRARRTCISSYVCACFFSTRPLVSATTVDSISAIFETFASSIAACMRHMMTHS